MNIQKNNLLTPNQMCYLLLGIMVNEGVLSIPNAVVKFARQDGWISVIIGAIYPIYMVFIAIYISRKFPQDNILTISKKYFGNAFGNILNLLFSILFIFYLATSSTGISNFLRAYILVFLSPIQFLSIYLLIAAYTAYKDLKVLGRLSETIFYIFIFIALVPLASLNVGSLLNIRPVFGSGFTNILRGGEHSAYSYGCIEILFLIYPFINDRCKLKSSAIKSVLITCSFYTWITFMTIYYLGINIIPKTIWSTVFVAENLTLPFISNFRYILLFLWILVTLKATALCYYASVFIINDTLRKVTVKELYFYTYPIFVYLSLKLGNEASRIKILYYILPIITIFSLAYVSILALLIFIKKDKSYEKR